MNKEPIKNWEVLSNIFDFHTYLGKIPILTNKFQRGWNHQLEKHQRCELHSFLHLLKKNAVFVFCFCFWFFQCVFGGLNSNCLTNFGMVINITAASAAFLVPTQAEGKFDPEQLEKAATKKRGVQELQTNATSGNPNEAGDFWERWE